MTTMTINQYNNIKKEAINKYLSVVEDTLWDNPEVLRCVQNIRDDVFHKLDQRQYKLEKKGVTMITLTTHGEIEC